MFITNMRKQAISTVLMLVVVSLLITACTDATATTPPAITTQVASTPAPTTAAPTIQAAIAAATTTVPATTVAATSPASATTLQVEVILKYDLTANPINNGGDFALDDQGNLYVIDRTNAQIQKYGPDGKFVTKWGKKGSGDGEFNFLPKRPSDGPQAGFLRADKQGNVYVSDAYNGRVQKFDKNGQFLLKWGGFGQDEGQFAPPVVGPINIDGNNNIYVSNFGGVNKFDANGKFLTKFAGSDSGSASKEGPFMRPAGAVWDKQGNMYIADFLNARVVKFDNNYKFILAFGTSGPGNGQFNAPIGLAQDSAGNLYVTDNTDRVQIFDSSGKFLAKLTASDIKDDNFESVGTVATDKDDNLYVSFNRASSGSYQIYKFQLKKA